MTGPEHYREAERLLSCEARDDAHEMYLNAAAQAHATLALAAATAHPILIKDWPDLAREAQAEANAWRDAIRPLPSYAGERRLCDPENRA